MTQQKAYLGDGLYARFDGHHVVLAASDGIKDNDTVYLDSNVVNAFERYIGQLRAGGQIR